MPEYKEIVKAVRWSESEWNQIKKQAELNNISPSRYVREMALGERKIDGEKQGKDNRQKQQLRALAKIGNNVNQMARVANETNNINADRIDEIRSTIGDISKEIVNELRR